MNRLSTFNATLLIAIVAILINGCSKINSYPHKLKGEWNIDQISYEKHNNDNCGVPGYAIWYSYDVQNAGTLTFDDEVVEETGTGEKHYSGTLNISQRVKDSSGYEFLLEQNVSFVYYIRKDLDGKFWVDAWNYSFYFYQSWPLEDLNRKKFDFKTEANYDCYGESTSFTCSKN